jgi:hypothetical protein
MMSSTRRSRPRGRRQRGWSRSCTPSSCAGGARRRASVPGRGDRHRPPWKRLTLRAAIAEFHRHRLRSHLAQALAAAARALRGRPKLAWRLVDTPGRCCHRGETARIKDPLFLYDYPRDLAAGQAEAGARPRRRPGSPAGRLGPPLPAERPGAARASRAGAAAGGAATAGAWMRTTEALEFSAAAHRRLAARHRPADDAADRPVRYHSDPVPDTAREVS